jgi:7,8-dihydro-6-hydroxymethylpterin dimethyltransferase
MDAHVDDKPSSETKYPLYYSTRTLCPVCNNLVAGKVVAKNNHVVIERECPAHGYCEGLICSDRAWYERLPQFYTEGARPSHPVNVISRGCPDDCGLCAAHSQIAGVLAIEVSNKCNSNCPCCITRNPDTFELTVRDVDNIVEAALKNQSSINTATLTGGEPTIHPHFFELLDALNRPDIDYVSVNTNGIRIANDEEFVKELATRKNVYVSLHYDGVHSKQLRGIDHSVQVRAANRLNEYGIEMVPVILVAKGYNDSELGSIIEHLFTNYPSVKSVNISLMAYTGENGSRFAFDPVNRLTIPEALESIEKSSHGQIRKADFIPIPMPNPLCTAIGYFLFMDNEFTSLFQFGELNQVIEYLKHGHFAKLTTEFSSFIRDTINDIYASPDKYPDSVRLLRKFKNLYQLLFPQEHNISDKERQHLAARYLRVIYLYQMMDSWTFDSKRLSRCSCQHGFPDGRIVPTCGYYCYHEPLDRRTIIE